MRGQLPVEMAPAVGHDGDRANVGLATMVRSPISAGGWRIRLRPTTRCISFVDFGPGRAGRRVQAVVCRSLGRQGPPPYYASARRGRRRGPPKADATPTDGASRAVVRSVRRAVVRSVWLPLWRLRLRLRLLLLVVVVGGAIEHDSCLSRVGTEDSALFACCAGNGEFGAKQRRRWRRWDSKQQLQHRTHRLKRTVSQ
jgi:hypothetical protein